MSTNNKTSNLITSQVPFFVRNDHPNFVAFLEAYYEYMEQEGKVTERSKNLPTYMDVDKTLDEFSELLYNHFLQFLPREIIADKDLLIKHVLEFYKARGTEKSTRFLFNILFNKPIDFYYPKRDVLRASDGKWVYDKYLNVTDVAVQNVANSDFSATQQFIHTKVYGRLSKASAVVDDVSRFESQGVIVDKLQVSSLRGNFIPGEVIYTRHNDGSFMAALLANSSLSSVTVTNQGTGYNVGDVILVSSNTGIDANVVVSAVSTGEVVDLLVSFGGAGFQTGNPIEITSDSGSGATAIVTDVDDSGYYHASSLTIWDTVIDGEANTILSDPFISMNTFVIASPNIDSDLIDVLNTQVITGLGPITKVELTAYGNLYKTAPHTNAIPNSYVGELGSLGRLTVVKGGKNYVLGDQITFDNLMGQSGFGALAEVTDVTGTGAILQANFIQYNDEPLGGSGYTGFPVANISSTLGTGAEILATARLGDDEVLSAIIDTFGKIKGIEILNEGSGYSDIFIDFSTKGDGNAEGTATLSTAREDGFKRFLNDDGMISAYNFLQNRDYYQNYSYVISIKESISSYKDAVKNLLHPTGMKLFGEYDYQANNSVISALGISPANTVIVDSANIRFADYSYTQNANVALVSCNAHGFIANNNVYMEFITTNELTDGTYFVVDANTDTFNVQITMASTTANGQLVLYSQVV